VVAVAPVRVKNTPVSTSDGCSTSAVLVLVNVTTSLLPFTTNDADAAKLPLDPVKVIGSGLAFAVDAAIATARERDINTNRTFFQAVISIFS
jgi:hypothetical protein